MTQSKCALYRRKFADPSTLKLNQIPTIGQHNSVNLRRRIERIHYLSSLMLDTTPWPNQVANELDQIISETGDLGLIWIDIKRSAAVLDKERFSRRLEDAREHATIDLYRLACHQAANESSARAHHLFANDPTDSKIDQIFQMLHDEALMPLMAFHTWIQHLLWTGKEERAVRLIDPLRVIQPSHPVLLSEETMMTRPLNPALSANPVLDFLETVRHSTELQKQFRETPLPAVIDSLLMTQKSPLKMPDYYVLINEVINQIASTSTSYLSEVMDIDFVAWTVVEKNLHNDEMTRMELLDVSALLNANFYRPLILVVHDLLISDDAATALNTIEALDSLYRGCLLRDIVPKIAIERALGLNPSLPKGPVLQVPDFTQIDQSLRKRLLSRLEIATTSFEECNLKWSLNDFCSARAV